MSQQKPSNASAKRGLTVDEMLAANKKQKMSTMDKTKHDWDKFRTDEGITEELKEHNKDGLVVWSSSSSSSSFARTAREIHFTCCVPQLI